MASAPLPRAVATAALQAAFSAAWTAALELSPGRRRLARVGALAAGVTAGYLISPPQSAASPASSGTDLAVGVRPFPVSEGAPEPPAEAPAPFDKRKAAVAAAVVVLSVAAIAGRRRMEKRWLARLTRNGHPHPTRALAVRMAGIDLAGTLALQLAETPKARALLNGATGGPAPRQ